MQHPPEAVTLTDREGDSILLKLNGLCWKGTDVPYETDEVGRPRGFSSSRLGSLCGRSPPSPRTAVPSRIVTRLGWPCGGSVHHSTLVHHRALPESPLRARPCSKTRGDGSDYTRQNSYPLWAGGGVRGGINESRNKFKVLSALQNRIAQRKKAGSPGAGNGAGRLNAT